MYSTVYLYGAQYHISSNTVFRVSYTYLRYEYFCTQRRQQHALHCVQYAWTLFAIL
jgi:hypothetical protein